MKRTDLKKIMVIGSGPIVVGQAAEFDYAGTQACIALKEEGYQVILINSNPATIMTDSIMADKVYMEPLNLEYVSRIIRKERPDAILPGIGGQTGLNLAMELHKNGILEECNVEMLGTPCESIDCAEDRELFKEMCMRINEPILPSKTTSSLKESLEIAQHIGYPVVLRPAFTLGGTGGGFANNEEELKEMMPIALEYSPIKQVLIEKSVKGFKEIEYEVMRDNSDKAIAICDMENVDPVGIHTGDSIVVAPTQTVSKKTLNILKKSALKIIKELKIAGGCNVQFAVNPATDEYFLIEVNPRVSRSSALASKASGYPIARVTAKIAVGLNLNEIKLINASADIEPTLNYIVVKMPRFPFDKFKFISNKLGTQMKAVGEVMSIASSLEEGFLKAIRSLENKIFHVYKKKFTDFKNDELLTYIEDGTDDRLYAICELIKRNISLDELYKRTKIEKLFLQALKNIVDFKIEYNTDSIRQAKVLGISDKEIAEHLNIPEKEIYNFRKKEKIVPVYKMIDTSNAKVKNNTSYYYSTYTGNNENKISKKKKIIVLGSGPIRIGQGVEFDYSTVHAIMTIKECGYEAIIINNNPETVSTDYTTADKLYFEPLTVEDIMNIVDVEKPLGVITSLGGQTAINLAASLESRGVEILGTSIEAIDLTENRDSFEKLMHKLDIKEPIGSTVTTIDEGINVAEDIGYPVLVRPSYVLGGLGMQVVANEEELITYLKNAVEININQPVLIDKYILGREVEVDAISDTENVFIPGIMEHVEKTGIHSGDSISVFPTFTINDSVKKTIIEYTKRIGVGAKINGLFNIQYIVTPNDEVYIIEVNPRSSRTIPFISKATSYPIVDIATKVMLGMSLKSQGIRTTYPGYANRWYVKVPTFSFTKFNGLDICLSPEMKSTGEAIGYDSSLERAFLKALIAGGIKVKNYGTVFVTVADNDKKEVLPLIKRFYELGFNIEATKKTGEFLKENGLKVRIREKIMEGSNEILDTIRSGHITYIINTQNVHTKDVTTDGFKIRRCAIENGVTIFTVLDTIKILLNVIEQTTIGISPIN